MREYSTPLRDAPRHTGGLADDVVRNAHQAPDVPVVAVPTPPGWSDLSAVAFLHQVQALAAGLVLAGVQAGDRMVLMSRTRWEWTLVDYAAWYLGVVVVPIYHTSTPAQVGAILAHSGASCAVVEDAAMGRVVSSGGGAGTPDVDPDRVWVIQAENSPAGAPDQAGSLTGSLRDLLSSGAGNAAALAQAEVRRTQVTPDTLATILYTSGTTGLPKGCLLTHGHLMFQARATRTVLAELFAEEDAATLLVLPLAHVLARIVEVTAITHRVRLGHSSDVRRLLSDLHDFSPTFLLGVPRIFERIFTRLSQEATSDGRGRSFEHATRTAIAYSLALDQGRRPGPVLRAQRMAADRLVYARFRAALGGRCRYAICGGAPLGDRLGHFYRGAGIAVLEGFGLTETTGAATLNSVGTARIGTVGRPLPGTSVRVSEAGELLVAGPHVFAGYWRDAAATEAAMTESGWLRTGDLGEIDNEGVVRVTGRMEEILVTAGGKNVAPAALEDLLRAHPLIGQAVVVGDSRPYIGALVTLDPDAAPAWARERNLPTELTRLAREPRVRAAVQEAVDVANESVSRAESIRVFTVLGEEWTEDSGHLTPTLKLRRNRVLGEYAAQIAALYDT